MLVTQWIKLGDNKDELHGPGGKMLKNKNCIHSGNKNGKNVKKREGTKWVTILQSFMCDYG